jgi:Flp pilus assembly protein TadD
MKMKLELPVVLLAATLVMPLAAVAVDTDPSPPATGDYAGGRNAVETKDWNGAIRSLNAAAQRDARNPDIYNLRGYAHRNAEQLEPAFKYYQRALQLDPRHRGAHEYIGEAYLMAGTPPKAEEHLAALTKICGKCEERDDLVASIERYKARKK